jgi:hypothetical protein
LFRPEYGEKGLNFGARYYYREMRAAKSSKKKAAPVAAVATEQTTIVDAPAPAPVATGKKKKPVKVVAVVTPNGIEGSFQMAQRRPLIVHLGIRSVDLEFSGAAPPAEPEPYDSTGNNMFANQQEHVLYAPVTEVGDVSEEKTVIVKSVPCFTKYDLMVQFKKNSELQKLPEKSDVACFWCVHSFDWQPCIIPEREVAGVYNVYGNFCSPECGVAYLLKEGLDPHVRWERMALLHRIYDREGHGQIYPAPARESLTLFGGPLSIEVFRATVREKKVRIDLHMPPMVSILGSIDTKPIDFFDLNLKQAALNGTVVLPQRSVEEGLRLKRSKPLKDKESTLDTVMNIRIGMSKKTAV